MAKRPLGSAKRLPLKKVLMAGPFYSAPKLTNAKLVSTISIGKLETFTSSFFPGISHGKLVGHHYFLSWREPWHKFEDWDWFNGRNFCRERCMDLVSFDDPIEFKMFEEVMVAGIPTH